MIGTRFTLIAAVVALVLGVVLLATCQGWRTAGAKAALGNAAGRAAVESGKDAIGAAGAVSASVAAYDEQGRKTDAEIRRAAGADTPVPAAVDAAVRRGLCRRAAYRRDPKCLQRAPTP